MFMFSCLWVHSLFLHIHVIFVLNRGQTPLVFSITACTPVRYIHLGPHGTHTPVQPSFLPLKRRRRYMAYPTCTDLVYSNHHYNYVKHPLFELALNLGVVRWRAEWSKRDLGYYMGHWLRCDDVLNSGVHEHKCPWWTLALYELECLWVTD